MLQIEIKSMYYSDYYTNKWGNKAKDILGWSVVALLQEEDFLGDNFAEGAIELAIYSKNSLHRRNPKQPGIIEATELEVLSPIYVDREGNKIDNLIIRPSSLLKLSVRSITPKMNKHGQHMTMSCGRLFYEVKTPLITGVVMNSLTQKPNYPALVSGLLTN